MSRDKLESQKQWNANPCGTGEYLRGIEYGSLEFFDEIKRNRYEVTDKWMKRIIDFGICRNKRLLEIGHGMGTDLLSFCEAGAMVYGIDITEEHHKLAQRNFILHGRKCDLKLCDAAEIDFPANHFDYVYSHGVLHHTPDTVRCISEAYRVLKPGGKFLLSVYYTYSAFHIFSMLIYSGIIQRRLFRLGYKGLMSTAEYGADGMARRPVVKTYSKRQLRHMLADFSRIEFKLAHFRRQHIPLVGSVLPERLEKRLEPFMGWYVVSFATK